MREGTFKHMMKFVRRILLHLCAVRCVLYFTVCPPILSKYSRTESWIYGPWSLVSPPRGMDGFTRYQGNGGCHLLQGELKVSPATREMEGVIRYQWNGGCHLLPGEWKVSPTTRE